MVRIVLFRKNGKGVNGVLIPAKDTNVAITKSIADITNVDSRNSSFSSSITLNGTDGNNSILNNIYSVNIELLTFDRFKRQPCRVEVDGVTIFDKCYLQLTDIKYSSVNENGKQEIVYTINVKSDVADFFTTIKTKEITDIELTDNDIPDHLNETYTPYSIYNSFGYDYNAGWKACLKNVTNGNAGLTDFVVAPYLWTIWNRIIKDAGYRYSFAEIGVQDSVLIQPTKDDLKFRNILLPYTSPPKQSSVADSIQLEVATQSNTWSYIGLPASGGYLVGTNSGTVPTDLSVSDPSGSFVSNVYTAQFAGVLKIRSQMTAGKLYFKNPNAGSVKLIFLQNQNAEIKLYHSITVIKNGTPFLTVKKQIHAFHQNDTFVNGDTSLENNILTDLWVAVPVLPSDTIEVKEQISPDSLFNLSGYSSWINLATNTSAFNFSVWLDSKINYLDFYATEMTTQSYGAPLNFNNFLPEKVKQSDFVKSVLNMFNLLVEIDDNDDRLLIIKTRDKYYNDGSIIDLTQYLDYSKSVAQTFLSDTQKKRKKLSYKSSTGVLGKKYQEDIQQTYGEVNYTFATEHTEGDDKSELIFSPAIMWQEEGYYLTEYTAGEIVLVFDNSYKMKPLNILGWGGVGDVSSIGYVATTHLDEPETPSFDLNFNYCESYYTSNQLVTNNNLFNMFWRRTFLQLDNGRMCTMYFDLKPHIFKQLRLDSKVYVDGTYYQINTIENYNPSVTTVTKITLLTVDDLATFNGHRLTMPAVGTGVSTPINTGGVKPTRSPFSGSNITFDPATGVILPSGGVRGVNNIVGGFETIVIGNGNVVTGDGTTVIGDDVNTSQDGDTVINGVSLIQQTFVTPPPPTDRPFKMKINSGASADFTIKTNAGSYLYNVRVSDGQTFDFQTGDLTISLLANTDYIIEITGTFGQFYNIVDVTNAGKILDIMQWGDIVWGVFQAYSFYNCNNLSCTATDSPNWSNVTFAQGFFIGCNSLKLSVAGWDMSNVIYMNSFLSDGNSSITGLESCNLVNVNTLQQFFWANSGNNISNGSNVQIFNTSSALTTLWGFNSSVFGTGTGKTKVVITDCSGVTDTTYAFHDSTGTPTLQWLELFLLNISFEVHTQTTMTLAGLTALANSVADMTGLSSPTVKLPSTTAGTDVGMVAIFTGKNWTVTY